MLRYIPHVFRRSFRRRIACRDIHFGRSGRKETENVRISRKKRFVMIRAEFRLPVKAHAGYGCFRAGRPRGNARMIRISRLCKQYKAKKYPGGSWFRTSGIYDANAIDPDLRTLRSGVFP